MTRHLAAIVFALCAPLLAAQEEYTPLPPLPLGPLLLSTPSNHVAAPGNWETRFEHRFHGEIDDGFDSLLGMDGGANVTLGIAYVPVRDLELSLLRSNALDDYELAAKYVVMQEAAAIPVTFSLRGGIDYRTEDNLDDRASFFAQATISRRIGNRAEIFATPTYVTNAGIASTGDTSGALFDHAFNLPLGAAWMVGQGTSIIAEWLPVNRDLPDDMNGEDGWALGIKRAVGRHHFEVMLTNSLGTTVQQYASSTWQGAPLSRGDVHIGFNIARRFGATR